MHSRISLLDFENLTRHTPRLPNMVDRIANARHVAEHNAVLANIHPRVRTRTKNFIE